MAGRPVPPVLRPGEQAIPRLRLGLHSAVWPLLSAKREVLLALPGLPDAAGKRRVWPGAMGRAAAAPEVDAAGVPVDDRGFGLAAGPLRDSAAADDDLHPSQQTHGWYHRREDREPGLVGAAAELRRPLWLA